MGETGRFVGMGSEQMENRANTNYCCVPLVMVKRKTRHCQSPFLLLVKRGLIKRAGWLGSLASFVAVGILRPLIRGDWFVYGSPRGLGR